MKMLTNKEVKVQEQCAPLDEGSAPDIQAAILALRIALYLPDAGFLGSKADAFLTAAGDYLMWSNKAIKELRKCQFLTSPEGIRNFVPSRADPASFYSVMLRTVVSRETAMITQGLAFIASRQEPVVKAMLRRSLERLDEWTQAQNDPIRTNVGYLSSVVGLDETEQAIMRACGYIAQNSRCQNVIRHIRTRNYSDAKRSFAALISDIPSLVSKAIRQTSRLREFGLIEVDQKPNDVEDLIKLPDHIAQSLTEEHADIGEFMRHFVRPARPSTLTVEDFPHLDRSREALKRFLGASRAGHVKGTNVLFYGTPGTGKTEFASILAHDAGFELFEVAVCDSDGAAPTTTERLASLAISQRFLANRGNSLIIFDEVEDVFPHDGLGFLRSLLGGSKRHGSGTVSKAWINRTLETNATPVIWISNAIDQIDPAYLRRFRYHLEFCKPPATVRRRIAEKYLGNELVSEGFIAQLVQDSTLTPAQLESASHFVKLSAPRDTSEAEELATHVIELAKRAHGRVPVQTLHPATSGYRLDYLNLDSPYPIDRVIDALRTKPASTLCLYGPPGTGKTALARHIAETIDRPLLSKRASDILDRYVGGTEENIATMFREAGHEGAVLFLDEADSLLRNRESARQRWEVTQVNELLQQMEQFNGLFICATNLFDDLDAAALRRFAFKIRFNPMSAEQRYRMFVEEALSGDVTRLLPDLKDRLRRLDSLVPGDFAVVARQSRLLGEVPAPHKFLQELESECAAKSRLSGRSIGFV
jgi:SpoVK/Ycf46/Vps4 family AAA+-type ATPase